MKRELVFLFLLFTTISTFGQSDQIVLKDLALDKIALAGMLELTIPSAGSLLAGMMYTPNGKEKHPTLILLHGFPGNEKNLDIAQAVRAHGWNVIYFNYRGSWGSQGKFSLENCVEDAKNVIAFCNKYQDSLKIDTANIALFGHSMGGFVGLKVLEQLPQIKKGFLVSYGNIYEILKPFPDEKHLTADMNNFPNYISINSTLLETYVAAFRNLRYYNLETDVKALKGKQILMLDEHPENKNLADAIKASGPNFFDYQVWDTDHSFTSKRGSLANSVLSLLDK